MVGYRIRLLLLLLWSWLPVVRGWVLISNDGDITLLGPIDIDPSYSKAPRITFRLKGIPHWNVHVMELTKNLVFSAVDTENVA